MTAEKHTPGPWFWCGTSLMASRRDHSETVLVTKDAPLEPSKPDASLIAAAPDMLAALELVWDKVLTEYHSKNSYVRQQVEAAIAKAERE